MRSVEHRLTHLHYTTASYGSKANLEFLCKLHISQPVYLRMFFICIYVNNHRMTGHCRYKDGQTKLISLFLN